MRVWDAATGNLVRDHRVPGGPEEDAPVLSSDGLVFAFTNGDTARVWEAATGKELNPILAGSLRRPHRADVRPLSVGGIAPPLA